MKSNWRFKSALPALAAVLCAFCTVLGCRKNEEPKPVATDYMKDPEFRAKIEQTVSARKAISGRRVKVQRALDELVKKCGGDLAKAKKSPEWATLEAQAKACDAEFDANRKKATELVRERLRREGTNISK